MMKMGLAGCWKNFGGNFGGNFGDTFFLQPPSIEFTVHYYGGDVYSNVCQNVREQKLLAEIAKKEIAIMTPILKKFLYLIYTGLVYNYKATVKVTFIRERLPWHLGTLAPWVSIYVLYTVLVLVSMRTDQSISVTMF